MIHKILYRILAPVWDHFPYHLRGVFLDLGLFPSVSKTFYADGRPPYIMHNYMPFWRKDR